MAAYIALFISLVSLILMIVILVRFKKLFSTDSIIEKTKSQMNRVIIDVNNHANRDLELLNESTRRIKALLNDADKKMESFREASELLRGTIAEAEKIKPKEVPLKIMKIYDDKAKESPAPAVQQELFTSKPESFPVRPQPAPRQAASQTKSLKDKVERLFNQGMQIDDIAAELSCSTSEVQFIIDML